MQMSKLIINIKELAQIRDDKTSFASASQMNEIPSLKNAFLLKVQYCNSTSTNN